ncbi:MAG: hypothetical protein IPN34_14860 [Planctomycetes bacterium]|nr:hypothetical protein [Planctomycetota bacterium]
MFTAEPPHLREADAELRCSSAGAALTRYARPDLLDRELRALHAVDAASVAAAAATLERIAGAARNGEHYLLAVGHAQSGDPFDVESGYADPYAWARGALSNTAEQGVPWRNLFAPAARFIADGVSVVRSGRRKGQVRRFSRRERDDHGRLLVAGIGSAHFDLDITGKRELADSIEMRGGELVACKRPLLEEITVEAIESFAFLGGALAADLWRTANALQGATLLAGFEHLEGEAHFLEAKRTIAGLAVVRVLRLARATGCTSDFWADTAHNLRFPGSIAQKRRDDRWGERRPCGLLHRAANRVPAEVAQSIIRDELGPDWRALIERFFCFGDAERSAKKRSQSHPQKKHRDAPTSEAAKIQSLSFRLDADGSPLVVNGTRVLDLPAIVTQPGESARDAFNRAVSLRAALRFAGWREAGGGGWTRPGSSSASAHANEVQAESGELLLHIFTTRCEIYEQRENLGAFSLVAHSLYNARTREQALEAERRFAALLRGRGIGARLTRGEHAARALAHQGDLPPTPRATATRSHRAECFEAGIDFIRAEVRMWAQSAPNGIVATETSESSGSSP